MSDSAPPSLLLGRGTLEVAGPAGTDGPTVSGGGRRGQGACGRASPREQERVVKSDIDK